MYFKKKVIYYLIFVTFTIVHFTLSSQLRNLIFNHQIGNLVRNSPENLPVELDVYQVGERIVTFSYERMEKVLYLNYKVPFGFFFFVAMSVLLLRCSDLTLMFGLIVAHLMILLLCTLLLMLTVKNYLYMISVDLLSSYLTPLSSFGILALSFLNKKDNSV